MKKLKIGLIAVLGVVLIVVAVIGIKAVSNYLNYYRITLEMDKSNNVSAGSNISLKGVEIGEIESVKLRNTMVAATMKIKKEIKIPIGSKFKIENIGLFGEKRIIVIPSESIENIKSNSIIKPDLTVAEPTDVAKAIGTLMNAAQAVEINKKLDSIIILLNQDKSNKTK